jgi:putative ABC transport system permease protein
LVLAARVWRLHDLRYRRAPIQSMVSAMTWFGLVFRNILRRPGRSLFTILGVALAAAGAITLLGLSRGMQDGTRDSLQERGIDLVVSRLGSIEIFGAPLDEGLEVKLRALPGVADVSGEMGNVVPINDGQPAFLVGWGVRELATHPLTLIAGRAPVSGQREVVLGDVLAETLKVKPGDTLTINYRPGYTVSGVAKFDTGILRGMAVMPLNDMQEMLAREGQVTVFQIRTSVQGDAAALARLKAAIEALAPGIQATTTDGALRSSRIIGMVTAASYAIGLIALIMAGLNLFNTIAMAVEERTREIGILSAIGWSRTRILALILCEGVALAALGGLAGIFAGTIGSAALSATVLSGSGLTAGGSAWLSAQVLIASIATGAISAWAPARRAAGMSPALAMTHQ